MSGQFYDAGEINKRPEKNDARKPTPKESWLILPWLLMLVAIVLTLALLTSFLLRSSAAAALRDVF